ncbi:hypothetical protein D1AOALGA4SA_7369 [Olavius algarvensis Delta 1 endosymbiont]|nr:hypothetical protein D1AOALGA4SA_7369 [Olavius algarvensis Delta 1 endosymbiont]
MQAEFIYTRTIEILVAILVGAFLCWLGYRLFYRGLSDKSDLKVEYGKVKFQIFSASPGIFFSLFGAAIIFASVWKVAIFQEGLPSGGAENPAQYTYIEKGGSSDTHRHIADFADIHGAFSEALKLHLAGKTGLAESLYLKILKSIPDLGRITNNLADLKNTQQKTDEALVYVKFSAMVFPEFDDARRTLAEIEKNSNDK